MVSLSYDGAVRDHCTGSYTFIVVLAVMTYQARLVSQVMVTVWHRVAASTLDRHLNNIDPPHLLRRECVWTQGKRLARMGRGPPEATYHKHKSSAPGHPS